MRIVQSVQTKVCVDGSLMKEYVLDEPLSEGFLEFLRNFGTVQSLENLRGPFFCFDQEYFISMKGFVGETHVEVRYAKGFSDLTADYFHLLLFYYREGAKGIATMNGIRDSLREKMKIRLRSPESGQI